MRIDYPRAGTQGWTRFIPSWRLALGSLFAVGTLGVLAGSALFAVAWVTMDVPEENDVASAQTSIVYWNDGTTEMARLGDTNRILIPLSEVPLATQRAVLAAEDRNFYEHAGFDAGGLARAAWRNLTTGSAQGGSTITQQYTKNAFLTSDKTYTRKFRELVLALKLEDQLQKDQILERYLNTIFFGRGTYGLQTASEAYFGTDARSLTLEQGVVLAAIINAPGRYSPDRNPELLQARYAYILNGMVEEGWVTPEERDAALEGFPEIAPRSKDQRWAGPTGHLLASVKEEVLERGFTEEQVESGGLRIVSTFDQQAQEAAVRAVAEQGPTTGTKRLRIGLASVVPGTGEVVALYGGPDYLKNSLNNATQATAMAGSTFKAFALAAATEAGIGLYSYWPGNSPHTVYDWTFQNYGNNSYGSAVSLMTGTENSINSVYVEVAKAVGVDKVRDMAVRAGIPEDTYGWDVSNNLPFVLGTPSPHTLDVAAAYATFAARGVRAEPTVIRQVTDSSGTVLYEKADTATRAMEENTADVVNQALQSVVRNGTGRPAQALGRPAAGKTGSTDEYKSAWFVGYTPQLATAVSFSKDDANGNPASLSGTGGKPQFFGSGFPARVWTSYMVGALQGQPVLDFASPAWVPTGGGLLAAPAPDPVEVQAVAVQPAPADPPAAPAPAEPAPAAPAQPAPPAGDGRGTEGAPGQQGR